MNLKYIGFFSLVLALAFWGCGEDEDYEYDGVVPAIVDGVQGVTEINQSFSSDFYVDYCREGSTWSWTAVDATVTSVSDDTKTATVEFADLPADGYAEVIVIETTVKGVVSDPDTLEVLVNQYCAIDSNEDLEGSWSGTDGFEDTYYDSQVLTFDATETEITIDGLNYGWIVEYWGESITSGGSVPLIINEDGTVEIEYQYYFTTDWGGSPYEYYIEGSGTWSNCNDDPEITIEYTLYNYTDGYELPSYYYDYSNFTATIVLDGGSVAANKIADLSALDSKVIDLKGR
jgi:hypothetical protein